MAELVYALCAIASIFCAWLLVANYRRTKVRLALWTSFCFVGLALNNVLLVIDLIVLPGNDLFLGSARYPERGRRPLLLAVLAGDPRSAVSRVRSGLRGLCRSLDVSGARRPP